MKIVDLKTFVVGNPPPTRGGRYFLFVKLIADNGGEVKKRENWGLRNLAYRMNKNRKGHYVLFNIDAPPAAIAELERNLRINEDILRFLTVRVEELEAGPSAILRKEERTERPFGDRGFGDREGRGGDRGDRPRRPRHEDASEGAQA